jgi:mRNA interferase MazF
VWRGEIYLVDLDPVRHSEANKVRPAVIVSNDGANGTARQNGRGVVTIVPITSNTTRIYPFHVHLPATETGLARDSKAQAEQVRSVSIDRLRALVGSLPHELIEKLDEALRLHLGL